MNVNLLLSDQLVLAGAVSPQAGADSVALTSGWIDMSLYERLLAVLIAGALGTACTVDAKLEQATSSGGAGAKDVTGKAITAFTKSPTDNSNKQALINLRADELDYNNGFTFVRLTITPKDTTSPRSATSLVSGVVLGANAKYAPAAQPAAVLQTVA